MKRLVGMKGVYIKVPDTDGSMEAEDYYAHWLTGKNKAKLLNATAGFIARLWSPVHVYVGAGYLIAKSPGKHSTEVM